MNCQDYSAALLESESAPPEALAHGRECPRCRTLVQLHTSARALRLVEPSPPAAIPYQAILGEVRRRQRRRRTVAGVGVSAALVLLAVLFIPRAHGPMSGEDGASGGVAVETSARIVQPSSEHGSDSSLAGQEFASLGGLLAEVGDYTRTSPGLEDAMYQPFGGLAFWVHASESEALESDPFQKALAVLAVSRSPRVVE